jgi:putative two-component system response regulator
MHHDEAKALIIAEKGSHFDTDVIDAFLHAEDAFQLIRANYGDRR